MVEVNEFYRLFWLQLWQVALLVAAVLLFTRFATGNRPHLAYALWMVVLIKCMTPPIFSSPVSLFSHLQPKTRVASTELPSESMLRSYRQDEPLTINRRLTPLQEPANPFSARLPADRAANGPRLSEANNTPHRRPLEVSLLGAKTLLSKTLLGLWMMSVVGGLVLLRMRVGNIKKKIHRSAVKTPRELSNLLSDLKDELVIRRPVKLVVTAARFGPCVLGMLRPTIVLPKKLIEKMSPEDLRVVLAHELVHIRRYDLSVGWFQALVQSVWWFNPLVWLANARLSREVERCCDEEVVAQLGIEPAEYARGLVRVLENMRLVKPVVACPGVRPMELTTDRLERIMTLRNGCRKRIPLVYVASALLMSAVALPGAAMVMAVQQEGERLPTVQENKDLEELPSKDPNADLRDSAEIDPQVDSKTEAYFLDRLVSEVQSAQGLSADDARKVVQNQIRTSAVAWTSHRPRRRVAGLDSELGAAKIEDRAKFRWDITTNVLFVDTTVQHHERLREATQTFSIESESYIVHTTVISCDEFTVKKLNPDWGAGQELSEIVTTERRDSIQAILRELQERGDASVLTLPFVSTINGTICSIQTGKERPFVVEVEKGTGQPIVELVQCGIYIQCRLEKQEDKLLFRYEISQTAIDEVTTVVEKVAGHEHTIQVPKLLTNKSQNLCGIRLGQGLLVGGNADVSESKLNKRFLCFFEIERINRGLLAERPGSAANRLATSDEEGAHKGSATDPYLTEPLPFRPDNKEWKPTQINNEDNGATREPLLLPPSQVHSTDPESKTEVFVTREFDLSFLTRMDDATQRVLSQVPAYLNHILSLNPKQRLDLAFESVTSDLDVRLDWSNRTGSGPRYLAVGVHRVLVTDTQKRIDQIQLAVHSQRLQMSIRNRLDLSVYRVKSTVLKTLLRDPLAGDGIVVSAATREYLTRTLKSEVPDSRIRQQNVTLMSELEHGFSTDALFQLKSDHFYPFANVTVSWDGPETGGHNFWLALQGEKETRRMLVDGVALPSGDSRLMDLTEGLTAEGYDLGDDRILLFVKCKTDYDRNLYCLAKTLQDKMQSRVEVNHYVDRLFPN